MTEAKVKKKVTLTCTQETAPGVRWWQLLCLHLPYLNPTLPRCMSTKKAKQKQGHVSRIKHNATVWRITKSIEKL